MPVRTVRFPASSLNQGDRNPGLEGQLVVLDHPRYPSDKERGLIRLRATAYTVAKAIGRNGTPYDTYRLELATKSGLVSATVPLHDSPEGIYPLAEGPRIFSQRARRIVLEKGLEWGQVEAADVLDLPKDGVALVTRGENINSLVANLRESGHPLSDHTAVVMDAAARSFEGQ